MLTRAGRALERVSTAPTRARAASTRAGKAFEDKAAL